MPPQNQQQEPAAATVRLPDFYADSPQFVCIDTMFATAKIMQPLTKFHWALAKLPFSLIATISPLAVQGPHRLQPPVQGAAGAPPALLRPQRRPDDG
jgi:hypothetical protein